MPEAKTKRSMADQLADLKARRAPTKTEVVTDLEAKEQTKSEVVSCPICQQSTRVDNVPDSSQLALAKVNKFYAELSRGEIETARAGVRAAMRVRRGKAPRGGEQ